MALGCVCSFGGILQVKEVVEVMIVKFGDGRTNSSSPIAADADGEIDEIVGRFWNAVDASKARLIDSIVVG